MVLRYAKTDDFDAFKKLDEVVFNDWLYGRDDLYIPKTKKERSSSNVLFSPEDMENIYAEVEVTRLKFSEYVNNKLAYVVEEEDGTIISAFILLYSLKGYYRISYWLINQDDRFLTVRKETIKQLANLAPKRCKGFSICSFSHSHELRELGFIEKVKSFFYIDLVNMRRAC